MSSEEETLNAGEHSPLMQMKPERKFDECRIPLGDAGTGSVGGLSLFGSSSHSNNLRRILGGVVLFVTAIAMTIPVRPSLILDGANNDASRASYYTGLLEATQAFLESLFSPMLGALADALGRKPILMISQVGEFMALMTVAAFRTNLTVQFFAYLLVAITSAYITTVNTMIADLCADTPALAPATYGILGAAIGLCFLVGPIIGGYIDTMLYRAASFHVASAVIVIAALYVVIVVPETMRGSPVPAREALASARRSPLSRVRNTLFETPGLAWLSCAIATQSLAQSGLISVMFLYVKVRLGWGTAETGTFLSASGLGMLIAQGAIAPVAVGLFGEKKTIIVGYSLSSIHFLVYGLARSTEIMYAGLAIGVFSFAASPAVKSVLARQAPPELQGELQGSLQALACLTKPVSSVMAAALFGYGNSIGRPGLVFYVIAIVSAAAVVIMIIAFRKPGLK